MEFVRVPAGEFTMGSDKDADEKPIHKVNLSEYLIGKYPVTNRQYQVFVLAEKYKAPNHWTDGKIPQNKEEHPVVYVSWEDATAYCKWASKVSGVSVRLPSEAEWEKAARGTDGRTYPWGEGIDKSRANYYESKIGETTKVGSYESGKSPYGVYDMAGNVWEWVNDWYDESYYQGSPSSNPQGPASGKSRVSRGGPWNNYSSYLRVSNRYRNSPVNRYYFSGFRCAR